MSQPAILQIHGTGTSHRNFDLLTPLLAPELRVYDIDLPSYGQSDVRDERRSVWDFAQDVTEFIDALGVPLVLVHGTSFGGAIAMAAASKRPDLIQRLVVSCSFGRLDRAAHEARSFWRSSVEWGGADALARVTSIMGFSRSFWDRGDARAVRHALGDALESGGIELFLSDLKSTLEIDLEAILPLIEAPTLLIGGAEDNIAPIHGAASGIGLQRLHGLIPSSRLVVLEECGHFVSLERAEALAELIREWVSTPTAKATVQNVE